jgi:hypothetical protein
LRAWRSSWYRQHVAVELAAVRVGHETPLEPSSSRDLAGLGPPAAEGLGIGGGSVEVVSDLAQAEPVLAGLGLGNVLEPRG